MTKRGAKAFGGWRRLPSSRRDPRRTLQHLLVEGEQHAAQEILTKEGLTPAGISAVMANALGWSADMAALQDQPRIACEAGCDWCCYLPADVTAPEVLWLAEWLTRTLTPEHLAEVRTRVRAAAARLAGQPQRARFGMRLACPLLENHRCLAYAARPAVCIANNALDPQACARVYRGEDDFAEPHAANASVYDAGILPAAVAHEALTAAGAPPAEVLELIEAL